MFQSQFYFIYKDINNLLIAMSVFFSHSCVEQAKHDHTFIYVKLVVFNLFTMQMIKIRKEKEVNALVFMYFRFETVLGNLILAR